MNWVNTEILTFVLFCLLLQLVKRRYNTIKLKESTDGNL